MVETTTTGTNTVLFEEYCPYRLPCGYCRILSGKCLKNSEPMEIKPTWSTSSTGTSTLTITADDICVNTDQTDERNDGTNPDIQVTGELK